jgi:hypothetical protein
MWRGGHIKCLGIALSLLVAACTQSTASPTTTPDAGPTGSGQATSTGGSAADCGNSDGMPFEETLTTGLTKLGETDGVVVSGAVYPHPDYEGEPWSQWGQGAVTADGHFYSAIGDHAGPDGNSYVFDYDPASRKLTMVGDVLSYVDHVPGTWGYGKIHSQMVSGPCGDLYFSTYWGSFRDIQFEGSYTGDILFRLDPSERTLEPIGVPVEHHGQASLASAPDLGLIYGEAADPLPMVDDVETGPFFVFDIEKAETVFTGPDEPHEGFRRIIVDTQNRAYYSAGDGNLSVYDPATGEITTHPYQIPGYWLRSATPPDAEGNIYGTSADPDRYFRMSPDGTITDLGPALDDVTSMALAPDGSVMYAMPGAHGHSADWGSPVTAVDTQTGDKTVVVEVNDMVEGGLGYTVGGTYDMAISADGHTLFMGVNVGDVGAESTFGEVVLLVIELP